MGKIREEAVLSQSEPNSINTTRTYCRVINLIAGGDHPLPNPMGLSLTIMT